MSIAKNCHLILVSGGKGGVGKSVFSVNLALTLIKEMRAKVLLTDLDFQSCGDPNLILGIQAQKTLQDLNRFTGSISPKSLDPFISKHSSGLHFIPLVNRVDMGVSLNTETFKKQMYSISQNYDYVVIDAGSQATEIILSLMESCSATIMLTTCELLVVNRTLKTLGEFLSASVPQNLFQLIVNKADGTGMSTQAVAQSLKLPLFGSIPKDDTLAGRSLQAKNPFVLSQPQSPMSASYQAIVRKLSGGTLERLRSIARPSKIVAKKDSGGVVSKSVENQPSSLSGDNLMKSQIHQELIKEVDLKKDLTNIKGDSQKEKELHIKTQKVISTITDRLFGDLTREKRMRTIKEVLNEALGLGPLEELLSDAKVTEIMVNGHDHIYVEKSGRLQLSNTTVTSNLHLRNIIERIVTPLGRRIDEKTPYVDARLQDGSRVNAIIEPLSIDGPALTIRKFPQDRITITDYVDRFYSLTKSMGSFLRICVENGLNVVISGGTGSGKTTLLNVLSSFIPENERIVTVEDAAELQLKQDHVVRLETRPANMEGKGEVSIRDLIRNSLRMRPDRIVVGECRDGAALDMLSAMNTGHDGSMTTVHANTPREAVSRIETLCMMAGMDLPAHAIREQIASAVNLIVQIGRLADGSRKVKSITEVVGMQGDTVTLQEIFRFKEEGFDANRKIIGQFQPMGLVPTFIEKLEQRGIKIPRDLFTGGGKSTNTAPVASSQKKTMKGSQKKVLKINKKIGSG